jgi:hypothetical protein
VATTPRKAPAKKAPRKAPAKKAVGTSLVKPDEAAKKAVRRTQKKSEPESPPRLSYGQVRIGKRSYALATDPNCVVCRHPRRALIEEQILLNVQFTALSRWISERDYQSYDGRMEPWPAVTPEQLSRHYNEDHSPIDARTVRDLVEQSVDVDEYAKVGTRIIDGLSFAKRVIGRVEERMVRGEIEPSFKDATAMARLTTAAEMAKHAADEADGADQSWFYEQAFDVLFEIAKEIMGEKQFETYLDRLRTDPTLRTLYERKQNPAAALAAAHTEEKSA